MPTATLQALIRQEAKDAMAGFLAEHNQLPAKESLAWAAWQSLLYSGLLLQALTVLPEKRILSWLDKQVQDTILDFRF